jgi:hypothetical protein
MGSSSSPLCAEAAAAAAVIATLNNVRLGCFIVSASL